MNNKFYILLCIVGFALTAKGMEQSESQKQLSELEKRLIEDIRRHKEDVAKKLEQQFKEELSHDWSSKVEERQRLEQLAKELRQDFPSRSKEAKQLEKWALERLKKLNVGSNKPKFSSVAVVRIENRLNKPIAINIRYTERSDKKFGGIKFDLAPHQELNKLIPLTWKGTLGFPTLFIKEKGNNRSVLKYQPSGSTEKVMLGVIENREGNLELIKTIAK